MCMDVHKLFSRCKFLQLATLLLLLTPALSFASDVGHGEHNVAYSLRPTDGVDPAEGGMLPRMQMDVLVDRHGVCRWLDNLDGQKDFFVPTKTLDEWNAFIENAGEVQKAFCCPAGNAIITASDGQTQSFALPTGRDNAAPGALGKQNFSHSFTVVGGIETIDEEYRCQGTSWVRTSTTTTFTPTACAPTTACEGNDEVTRDCGGVEIGRSVNACAAACVDTTACEGFDSVTRNCLGAEVTRAANACAPCPHTTTCEGNDRVTRDCNSWEVARDINACLVCDNTTGCEGNDSVTRNCWGTEVGRVANGCFVCGPNTSGCEGVDMVTRNCHGAEVGRAVNQAACGYVPPAPVCFTNYGAFDVDGWATPGGFCSNFNLYEDHCAGPLSAGYISCDINVTVNLWHRCAGDVTLCYIP